MARNFEDKSANLAVLIDADNASARDIKAVLEEATKFGEVTAKRIYGNFVGGNSQWKEAINELAIKPMQQFAFTTGKNATDGFMIIDAMDLLYTNRFDGFCIVSSDSDFTALAIRLKEQGIKVYGFGKKQTPTAFINACSQFIYVENLIIDENKETQQVINNQVLEKPENQIIANNEKINHDLPLDIIQKVFAYSDDEWIAAAILGSRWRQLQVDFDPRNYGCSNLTTLVKKYPAIFEYEMKLAENNKHTNMYVKLKV